MMREADALEVAPRGDGPATVAGRTSASSRTAELAERRNSDDRAGRTDTRIAAALGLGGKDLYRQARAVWKAAQAGDPRAESSVAQLDAGTKTIHAAYKDLRRRDRFTAGFRPTPYDVWAFRHDRAFGIPHPGSIPPAIVAHTLHYFTDAGALVVDPMAGGGTTLDVCHSMGRRCLAYDIHPVRPDIRQHDVKDWISAGIPRMRPGLLRPALPHHARPPLRRRRGRPRTPLTGWIEFLERLRAERLRRPPPRRPRRLPARQPDREGPAGRPRLHRPRLLRLQAP